MPASELSVTPGMVMTPNTLETEPMQQPTYAAAYVPDVETRTFDDALAPAIRWIEEQCAATKTTAVLVTPRKTISLYPENLQVFVARNGNHATPMGRYRQRVPRGRPTLVYVPDEQMLDMGTSYANGAALVAVEDASFRLGGWAAAVGAINLDTGQVVAAPPEDVIKLLEHIVFLGNNGYGDKYTKNHIGVWIDKLLAVAPELDGAFVGGWVLAHGRSDDGAKNIRALVDARRRVTGRAR